MTEPQCPPAPQTLAEALRMAVEDGWALLAMDPGAYWFAAGVWHSARTEAAPCTVCLAGTVLARRLGVDEDTNTGPDDVATPWARALYALDALRATDWADAWVQLYATPRLLGRQRALNAQRQHARAFAQAMDAALQKPARTTREALRDAGEFRTRTKFARYLDLVRTVLIPVLERCEAQTLSEQAKTAR